MTRILRRSRGSRPAVALAIASFLVVGDGFAAGPTTADCLGASESYLKLRSSHRLRDARAQLLTCASPTCPADIRTECERHVAEVNLAIPTLVFVAKDAAGNDLIAVKVTVDGNPLVDRLDGTALPLDPGAHSFHFEAAGTPAVDKTIVVNEGQQDRRERVVFASPTPDAATAQPKPLATLVVSTDEAATVSVDGKVVGSGGYRAQITPGPHTVRVTERGKTPYRSEIDVRESETRTLEVTLQGESHGAVWPWVAGGVAIVAGAVIGGYFLLKPSDTTTPPPTGTLGGVQLSNLRPGHP